MLVHGIVLLFVVWYYLVDHELNNGPFYMEWYEASIGGMTVAFDNKPHDMGLCWTSVECNQNLYVIFKVNNYQNVCRWKAASLLHMMGGKSGTTKRKPIKWSQQIAKHYLLTKSSKTGFWHYCEKLILWIKYWYLSFSVYLFISFV